MFGPFGRLPSDGLESFAEPSINLPAQFSSAQLAREGSAAGGSDEVKAPPSSRRISAAAGAEETGTEATLDKGGTGAKRGLIKSGMGGTWACSRATSLAAFRGWFTTQIFTGL